MTGKAALLYKGDERMQAESRVPEYVDSIYGAERLLFSLSSHAFCAHMPRIRYDIRGE